MEEANKENTSHSTRGVWGFFIIMLIPAMIVGGVFYFWNQSSIQMLQDEIKSLKKQVQDFNQRNQSLSAEVTTLQEENDYYKKTQARAQPNQNIVNSNAVGTVGTSPIFDNTNLPLEQNAPSGSAGEDQKTAIENSAKYCAAEPMISENGRSSYPINIEKYGSIGYLGELFTAYDCGPERLAIISGVKDGQYTIWPDIVLHEAPSMDLLALLKGMGFMPAGNCAGVSEQECKHWSIKESVPIAEIIKLIPYAGQIISSGCLNCG
jgi:cell division protein FtsL